MYKNKSILALIPARGGSKGLPNKNLRLIDNKPLVSFPIDAARQSKYIDKIALSSDSEAIMEVAANYHCEVPFKRPQNLAEDSSSSMDVILHAINHYEQQGTFFDYLILLEPTSPLTETKDIDEAIEMLIDNQKIADSIIGVSQVEATHPMYLAKVNEAGTLDPYARKDFSTPIRRQDLDELFFFEGSLYISSIEALKEQKTFVHQRTLPFKVPRWKSIEIDEYSDFIIAELFYDFYIKNKTNIK